MNKGIKRALSLALCVVMLVSCWVFTAPTANAEDGDYDFRITFDLHDGMNDDHKGHKSLYWKVYYKENNGTDSTEKNIVIPFGGSQTIDGTTYEDGFGDGSNWKTYFNAGNSTTYTKTYDVTLPGFPTGFYCFIESVKFGFLSLQYDGVEYHIRSLAVKNNNTNSYVTLWSGDLKNYTGADWRSGSIDINGTAKSEAVNTSYKSEYTCTTDNEYSSGDEGAPGNGSNSTIHYSNNFKGWNDRKPVPAAINGLSYSNITASAGATSSTNAPTVMDNYGVKILQPTIAYSVASYKYDTTSGEDIPAENIDYAFDSTNGTVSAAAGGYVANGHAAHILTARVSATCNDSTLNADNNITITYPSFGVTWKYYTSTSSSATGIVNTDSQNTVLYGDTPVMPASAATYSYYDSEQHHSGGSYENNIPAKVTSGPITIEMEYDTNENHSLSCNGTYTDDGHTLACSGCAYTEQEAHEMSAPTAVTPATCTTDGLQTSSCNDCAYSTNTTIPATGHSKVEAEYSPEDGLDNIGTVYITCENCDACWGATYNAVTHEYEQTTPDAQPAANVDAAIEASIDAGNIVPAPAFNRFNDRTIKYNYAQRGASLKLSDPKTYTDCFTRQALRFTASLAVPEDVSYLCGDTSQPNRLIDFGYVYSQTELIGNDISNLYEGAPNVYKMSVAENNSALGPYDGTNWSGVSHHTSNGDVLTFNLVVRIKAHNWNTDYCARAYLTYIYNGHTYTVYDSDFSSRSVVTIATAVVGSSSETETAKKYCQNKILDNYQAAIDEWESLQPNA